MLDYSGEIMFINRNKKLYGYNCDYFDIHVFKFSSCLKEIYEAFWQKEKEVNSFSGCW